jgi:hypothetical protein
MLVILLIIHVELVGSDSFFSLTLFALFAWLISHQPTVLFSQNKPATSNQPEPASSTLLSEQTSTIHQPPAKFLLLK